MGIDGFGIMHSCTWADLRHHASLLPGYRAIVARREEAQLAFPSIVIELCSSPADQSAELRCAIVEQ